MPVDPLHVSRRAFAGGFAALVASVAGTHGAAAAEPAARGYNPVGVAPDYTTTDPPFFDPEHPPVHFPHTFLSGGKQVQSFMWLANGKEAKGCVIFATQAYGGEAMDSLIPVLAASGINVLRYHPRGMWDDDQEYTFPSALEDIHSAVAFLRQNGGNHIVPKGTGAPTRPFRIDLDRIAVIGRSGGGGMLGWIAAAENPNLNTVISVSPAELLPLPLPSRWAQEFADLKATTAGRIDMVAILNSLTPSDYNRLNMRSAASKLVNDNVLLIGHADPDYLKGIHEPLVASMRNAKKFSEVTLLSTSYLMSRVGMTRIVVSWLKNECGF